MNVEKIYKSLTTKELGVYKGTEVDETDGKIKHTLVVDGVDKEVSDSTFKRWWKLVEETTTEDLQQSMDSLNQIKDVVLNEQPTVEDLIQLNETGQELTEEELQLFKEHANQVEQQEVVHELPEGEPQPINHKPRVRKSEMPHPAAYIMTLATNKGAHFTIYSEGREGVIKSGGKAVIFFGFVRGGVRLYLKEPLDSTIKCPYPIEEKHSYPKQFPFRLYIPEINDDSEQLIEEILNLHI